MEATVITAGIACIAAAIVGGGLKAFGFEIRALDSLRRQAALGVFGVVLTVAGLTWNGAPSPAPSPGSTPASTVQPQVAQVQAAHTGGSAGGCNPAWFHRPALPRVVVIESGTADADIVSPNQSKDEPVIVVITEDAKPVGAIAFKLYTGNDLFKITQVVNASCEPVETFRNESRGGDPRVLQNYDTVEVTFGAVKYALRLGYGAGTIGGTLTRV